MIKKILLYVLGFILTILCVLAVFSIYKFVFNVINPEKVPTIFGYSDYIVTLDNLENYNKGDLVILKEETVYKNEDYVLYYYLGSKVFDEIVNTNRDEYTMKSGKIINYNDIVGKSILTINNFESVYNFITSPIIIIILLVSTVVYFFLIIKGKVKES